MKTRENDDFIAGQAKKVDQLVTKITLPADKNDTLSVNESFKLIFWVCAPHDKGNHRLDLVFYYENSEPKSVPKYRLNRCSWHLTVLDSIQSSAVTRRSAVSKNDFSSVNLTVQVKNSNQVHDPFMNEIELTQMSLQSDNWTLTKFIDGLTEFKVQPQEMIHLMLKLIKKEDRKSDFSDVSLSENSVDPLLDVPYTDFIRKRHFTSLNSNEGQTEQKGVADNDRLSLIVRLDSTLIVRWKAKVTEGGVVVRDAIGQHYIDLEYLNKSYSLPSEKQPEPIEYSARLMIFGPDANVPDARATAKKDYSEVECLKSIVMYYLKHSREVLHDFDKSRICIVPVVMEVQNNSESHVDVNVDTIGTSRYVVLKCFWLGYL